MKTPFSRSFFSLLSVNEQGRRIRSNLKMSFSLDTASIYGIIILKHDVNLNSARGLFHVALPSEIFKQTAGSFVSSLEFRFISLVAFPVEYRILSNSAGGWGVIMKEGFHEEKCLTRKFRENSTCFGGRKEFKKGEA